MYLQQGDVLLKLKTKLPKNLKPLMGGLIHQGYSHHHVLEGNFEILNGDDGFFVVAKEPCQLVHPEHKTITVEVGIYEKQIVKEYDHFTEESREVVD